MDRPGLLIELPPKPKSFLNDKVVIDPKSSEGQNLNSLIKIGLLAHIAPHCERTKDDLKMIKHGVDLHTFLVDKKEAFTMSIFVQMLFLISQLEEAGFKHGDLKLENFVINDGKVLLIDFEELAKLSSSVVRTTYLPYDGKLRSSCLIGTSNLDSYALGVTLYMCATNKHEWSFHNSTFEKTICISIRDTKFAHLLCYVIKSLVTFSKSITDLHNEVKEQMEQFTKLPKKKRKILEELTLN